MFVNTGAAEDLQFFRRNLGILKILSIFRDAIFQLPISDVFENWDEFSEYLSEQMLLDDEDIIAIENAQLDVPKVQ